MKRANTKILLAFGTLSFSSLVILLSGCSTPRTAEMVPPTIDVRVMHPEKVFVNVQSRTNAAFIVARSKYTGQKPVVTTAFTEAFHEALVQSLARCKLYQLSDSAASADFILEVTILRGDTGVENGFASGGSSYISGGSGTALSAYTVARWCFKSAGTDKVICEKDFTTAGDNNRYFNPGAQRDAIETAASANIRAGLEWLARRTQ